MNGGEWSIWVVAFQQRWGGQVRCADGCHRKHRTTPYANLAAMGAAWVLARNGHRAVAVTRDSVLMTAPTGSRLRIFRGEVDPGSVLAWSLCRPATGTL
jgi:hypothetical protein